MSEITITKAEYRRLLIADALLSRLEAWGVDNWCGWDEARSGESYDGVSYRDEVDQIKEDYQD